MVCEFEPLVSFHTAELIRAQTYVVSTAQTIVVIFSIKMYVPPALSRDLSA